MDYTITPAPPRSLVRRLAPWTAALGLFAGGGYGVYRYAMPVSTPTAAAEPANAAETGESATARVLAAVPGGAAPAEATRYTTPFDAEPRRYAAAPTLPPAPDDEVVTTPRSAATVDAPSNPFATTPINFSDQYGAAPTTTPAKPATDAVEPPAEETPAEPPVSDVARGQEPGDVNPLRSDNETTPAADAAATDEARAAFSDSAAGTAAPTLPMVDPRYAAAPPDASTVAVEAAPTGFEDDTETLTPTTAPATAPYSGVAPLRTSHAPTYAPMEVALPSPPADVPTTNPYVALPSDAGITPTPGLATADGTGRPGERILEGLQTPTLTVQKLAPPEIQVGKKATFAVRIQNNSQRTAHNVQVVDEVPLGTQLIGTAPKANVSGAQVVWDLGTLSAGEERIVEMELMPTDEGEIGSVATVTFATQASAKTRSTRPQLALRLSANPRVMIGDQHIVQIEVTNPGSGDATGVMLLESIPQGVSHEAGPALEFEVGTLRPGETRRLELVLQADAAGMVDNVMTARADANLQVQANCQFEVIAPELKVTVEGPARRILERPATYTVSVDNPGTASARDVQLVTQLPKGLQFVSANNMGEYDAATHSVFWSLAELPANQRGTVELTALAVEAGEHTLQFATRAEQGLEDRTETQVLVEGIVALSFEVQDVEDAIEVGGETAYEVRVTNQGSKAATNVQVVATMPAGLRAQAGQGDARYVVEGDRVVFAPLPQLAPKADASFGFRVQGLRPGDQRITLQVTTDEVRDPIIEVESTQVYADD
jgi:uncharacterized repeat protein (TIGR01451 family)